MENYKVKVNSEAESKEVQELFFELGAKWKSQLNRCSEASVINVGFPSIFLYGDSMALSWRSIEHFNEDANFKEITIPQLKDMVVLKRNDVADATHVDQYGDKWVCIDSIWYFYTGMKKWDSFAGSDFMSRYDLKPVTKAEPFMKKYLNKLEDGTYKLVVLEDVVDGHDGLIEVPEGADKATLCGDYLIYWKGSNLSLSVIEDAVWRDANNYPDRHYQLDEYLNEYQETSVIWQRDAYVDSVTDINTAVGIDLDILAKNAGFRARKNGESDTDYRTVLTWHNKSDAVLGAFDTQVGGDHYKSLAIQPMRYALENKLDYAQANVVKYVTRHASKGGKEDLLKAKHNIELMIEHYYKDGK